MSKFDKGLVEGLNLTYAELARILNRSRQAISRGVNGKSQYFRLEDLHILMAYWNEHDLPLEERARKLILSLWVSALGHASGLTTEYLVQVNSSDGGSMLLGTIPAISQEKAQHEVVLLLQKQGILADEITREVTTHQRLSLRNGTSVLISPMPTLDQRIALVAQLAKK